MLKLKESSHTHLKINHKSNWNEYKVLTYKSTHIHGHVNKILLTTNFFRYGLKFIDSIVNADMYENCKALLLTWQILIINHSENNTQPVFTIHYVRYRRSIPTYPIAKTPY